MRSSSLLTSTTLPFAAAFVSHQTNLNTKTALHAELASPLPTPSKPVFDPLGLYPEDSPERIDGLIVPLERITQDDKKVVWDPLRLYQDESQVSSKFDSSPSLPFLARPALLDGTLPGDRGFDPFNFSSDMNSLQWQRRAEIKHARLAMLAAVGWPIAELAHKSIASSFDLPSMLASADRVPSVLNDGLAHAGNPFFWIAAIAAASAIEMQESVNEARGVFKLDAADISFGGKSAEGRHYMEEGELFNGRLAMLAITGFAIQEAFLNSAVVDQIPIFFKPMNVVFEQLMNAQ